MRRLLKFRYSPEDGVPVKYEKPADGKARLRTDPKVREAVRSCLYGAGIDPLRIEAEAARLIAALLAALEAAP